MWLDSVLPEISESWMISEDDFESNGDCPVLARTDAQSRALKDALDRELEHWMSCRVSPPSPDEYGVPADETRGRRWPVLTEKPVPPRLNSYTYQYNALEELCRGSNQDLTQ